MKMESIKDDKDLLKIMLDIYYDKNCLEEIKKNDKIKYLENLNKINSLSDEDKRKYKKVLKSIYERFGARFDNKLCAKCHAFISRGVDKRITIRLEERDKGHSKLIGFYCYKCYQKIFVSKNYGVDD